jgi:nitroreductase
MTDLLTIIKHRRSIRKYEDRQIDTEDLKKIVEAGMYAPNAGGGQRTVIVAIHNKELAEIVGKLNLSGFSRANLIGSYVSKEQPSVIDDPSIKNGFYGAPTVCAVFAPSNFLYGNADAFCCASYMVLEAENLGISSCIVARGKETFDNELGSELLSKWDIPQGYTAVCFVALGYCKGEYPMSKPRKEDRFKLITDN